MNDEPTALEVRDVLVTALHEYDLALSETNTLKRQRHFDAARSCARQANDEIRVLSIRERV